MSRRNYKTGEDIRSHSSKAKESQTLPKPNSDLDAKPAALGNVHRPVALVSQVEQAIRKAIEDFAFPGGRLPTLIDLAEQLRVSRETVRLALESLQQEGLILKRRRRGTVVNTSNTTLALKRPDRKVLAYLFESDSEDGNTSESIVRNQGDVLQGAILEASLHGYRIVPVLVKNGGIDDAVAQAQEVAPISGFIFATELDKQHLKEIRRFQKPFISMRQESQATDENLVVGNPQQSAQCAVSHLTKLGHERIACIDEQRPNSRPRFLQGYKKAMADNGLKRRRLWEIEIKPGESDAKQAFDQIARISPLPTAVICYDNVIASRFIAAALCQGMRVPDDVSVVGGGGCDIIGLCSCHIDWSRVGQQAVTRLLDGLGPRKPTKSKPLQMDYELRSGGTAISVTAEESKSPKRRCY